MTLFTSRWYCSCIRYCSHIEVAIRRAGPGQQWAEPKPGRAKIGPIFSGQDFNSPARPKNRAGQAKLSFQGKKKFELAGPGQAIPGRAIPGRAISGRAKFGPVFFGPII